MRMTTFASEKKGSVNIACLQMQKRKRKIFARRRHAGRTFHIYIYQYMREVFYMENYAINTNELYNDIKNRTGGEIYIGVLGPVRTGKSTFIKRFMEEMVLPYMEDEHERSRAQDELPQSAGGRTITTTEPKFIPNEAADVVLSGDVPVSVRLIDCVGYMVEGAAGHMEEDVERMVKTPWFDYEIPFTQAAEIGTDKVMNDHSTIGLVVTTDGSFGEIPRSSYLEAEEKTILALKKLRKPFLVLVNSQKPYSEEAKRVAGEISDKYGVAAVTVNCEQLKKDDIHMLLENVLYEFPISSMEFYMPKWVEMLPGDNRMKQDIVGQVKGLMKDYGTIRDVLKKPVEMASDYIKRCKTDTVSLSDGVIRIMLDVEEAYYYEMLTEMVGETITDEYQLISRLKDFAVMKHEYAKVLDAVNMVRIKGYGVVTPDKDEIVLEKPELIKHGNKFGVKIRASSPSIHMIRANIETEIAPIVGTQEQANDLIHFINQADMEKGIWETNIFGKTVEQLVNDGITAKVAVIGEESQLKLQDTMQKIVNDSNGGMVCIII
jgi:stage IV sporulation protein A